MEKVHPNVVPDNVEVDEQAYNKRRKPHQQ
jgi:hypothetical protein